MLSFGPKRPEGLDATFEFILCIPRINYVIVSVEFLITVLLPTAESLSNKDNTRPGLHDMGMIIFQLEALFKLTTKLTFLLFI